MSTNTNSSLNSSPHSSGTNAILANNTIGTKEQKLIEAFIKSRYEEIILLTTIEKIRKTKTQSRILAICKYHIFTFKPNCKLAREAHLLEISSISSPSADKIKIKCTEFEIQAEKLDVNQVLSTIIQVFSEAFPNMPKHTHFTLEVDPPSRTPNFIQTNITKCGGFSSTFISFLHYFKIYDPNSIFQKNLIWQMDHIYESTNNRSFNWKELGFFEMDISLLEMNAILSSLIFNTYFHCLVLKGYKFEKETFQTICGIVKSNSFLRELILPESQLNASLIQNLAIAMEANKNLGLSVLDLHGNNIEDKGVIALSDLFFKDALFLERLNLSNCGITPAGFKVMFEVFKGQPRLQKTLKYFDFSYNKIGFVTEDMVSWIEKGNELESFKLNSTEIKFDLVLVAITSSPKVTRVDLACNLFNLHGDGSQMLKIFNNDNFQSLDLSKVHPTLKFLDLLFKTPRNASTTLKLKLRENDLSLPFAQLVSVSGIKAVTHLDLSDNDLGEDGLLLLFEGLKNAMVLKELILDRNFRLHSKNGSFIPALEALLRLLNTSAIISLSLVGSSQKGQLKEQLIPFLQGLCEQCNLVSLNIANNQIGPKGAVWLGNLLQLNGSLKQLEWDDNNTSLSGFIFFYRCLKSNFFLTEMNIPFTDVTQLYKILSFQNVQQLSKLLNKIEKILRRNLSLTPSQVDTLKKGSQDFKQNLGKLKDYDQILRQIISDKELALGFREFLHKSLNNENFSFWLEVENAKKLDPSEFQRKVNEIYKIYIQPGSVNELNIDSKSRRAIESQLNDPPLTIYDDLQEDCWKHLAVNCIAPFLKSPFYANYSRGVRLSSSVASSRNTTILLDNFLQTRPKAWILKN